MGRPKGMPQVLWEHRLLDPGVSYIAQLKKNNPNLDGTILVDCSDFISIKSYMRKLMILGKGQNLYTGEIGVPQKVGRKTSVHLLLIVCLPRKDLGWEAWHQRWCGSFHVNHNITTWHILILNMSRKKNVNVEGLLELTIGRVKMSWQHIEAQLIWCKAHLSLLLEITWCTSIIITWWFCWLMGCVANATN